LRCYFIEFIFTAGSNDYVGTGIGQTKCYTTTNSSASTCYDGNRAIETEEIHDIGVCWVEWGLSTGKVLGHGKL
jgi:hypothetical protein